MISNDERRKLSILSLIEEFQVDQHEGSVLVSCADRLDYVERY